MNRDSVTLLQIADSAQLIVVFSQDLDMQGFAENLLTRSAVLYQFAVLGEAVKRLSEEFRNFHAAISWSEIAGMRDRLIHGYDAVNMERVWDAVKKRRSGIASIYRTTIAERGVIPCPQSPNR